MRASFGKYGPKSDYRGAHVTLGKLVGEVTDIYRDEMRGFYVAKVRHFNGEPWPFDPALIALDILEERNNPRRDDE